MLAFQQSVFALTRAVSIGQVYMSIVEQDGNDQAHKFSSWPLTPEGE
jgi:hypothetical protein